MSLQEKILSIKERLKDAFIPRIEYLKFNHDDPFNMSNPIYNIGANPITLRQMYEGVAIFGSIGSGKSSSSGRISRGRVGRCDDAHGARITRREGNAGAK